MASMASAPSLSVPSGLALGHLGSMGFPLKNIRFGKTTPKGPFVESCFKCIRKASFSTTARHSCWWDGQSPPVPSLPARVRGSLLYSKCPCSLVRPQPSCCFGATWGSCSSGDNHWGSAVAQAHPGWEGLPHLTGLGRRLSLVSLAAVEDSGERSQGPFEDDWPTLCYLPIAWHIWRSVQTVAGPPLWCWSPVFILCIVGLLWKTKMRICPSGSSEGFRNWWNRMSHCKVSSEKLD